MTFFIVPVQYLTFPFSDNSSANVFRNHLSPILDNLFLINLFSQIPLKILVINLLLLHSHNLASIFSSYHHYEKLLLFIYLPL